MEIKFAWLALIPAVIILLLVLPVIIEVRVSFNPLYNRGVIALYIFRIKALYYCFSFRGGEIKLENEKSLKVVQIKFSGESLEVLKSFTKEIQCKVKLKNLCIYYNIGAGDAFDGALVCGLLNQIFLQVFVQIKNRKPTATLVLFDNVLYNKLECELACRTKISISFWDLICSFIYVIFQTRMHNKV